MNWIEGFSDNPLNAFGFGDRAWSPQVRLQRFTKVLNGLSYVLGPVIAAIRLLAVLFLTLSICVYSRKEKYYEGREKDLNAAKEYVGWMVVRALADCIGPFSAIFDRYSEKKLDGETYYLLDSSDETS